MPSVAVVPHHWAAAPSLAPQCAVPESSLGYCLAEYLFIYLFDWLPYECERLQPCRYVFPYLMYESRHSHCRECRPARVGSLLAEWLAAPCQRVRRTSLCKGGMGSDHMRRLQRPLHTRYSCVAAATVNEPGQAPLLAWSAWFHSQFLLELSAVISVSCSNCTLQQQPSGRMLSLPGWPGITVLPCMFCKFF